MANGSRRHVRRTARDGPDAAQAGPVSSVAIAIHSSRQLWREDAEEAARHTGKYSRRERTRAL